MALTLLKNLPPQPQKPDLPEIYQRILKEILFVKPENQSKAFKRKKIYFLIKGLPIIFGKKIHRGFSDGELPTENWLDSLLTLVTHTDNLIGELTPRELIQMFPITKKYNGDKTESKDYFHTMEKIEAFGIDVLIDKNVSELFFDYQNRHITNYAIFKLGVIDDLRRHQGKQGMLEEFMSSKGVEPVQIVTGYDGKEYLFDKKNNTTTELKKARPQYLRVVK